MLSFGDGILETPNTIRRGVPVARSRWVRNIILDVPKRFETMALRSSSHVILSFSPALSRRSRRVQVC
jgi:hypothetical protein